ncbi:MAG: LysE family transporter [Candidatus Bathyarchaeota archaeon]|nr:LysE family transporter [Candidatus Bathyarchaeota archaeon]
MEMINDFYLFLLSVIVVSLSGVMSPGPLFAVTIAKASKEKNAGILISIGHGVVEFPLMSLIYLGFAWVFTSALTQKVIGFVGGALMIYLGFKMLKNRGEAESESSYFRYGSIISGILATAGNPYFLLWWATIGAFLVINAAIFGIVGFLIFALTHWSCDLVWNIFVSLTVFKSRRFWTKRVHEIVFGFCFLVLTGFGVWFIISALR